jgi:hypothetical protein
LTGLLAETPLLLLLLVLLIPLLLRRLCQALYAHQDSSALSYLLVALLA